MITLDEAKKELAEQIELSDKLWQESAPQRSAQDAVLKPWHEANRRIDGLKAIIAVLETEGK
jgi:hypothetical protein